MTIFTVRKDRESSSYGSAAVFDSNRAKLSEQQHPVTFFELPADVDQNLVLDDGEQRLRRRHASRIAARETAQVYWKDDLEVPHEETVTLVNASAKGLAFLAYSAFRPGHQVTVRTERYTLDCVVRHVQEAGSCRCVGVEVVAEPGSTSISQPERLDER